MRGVECLPQLPWGDFALRHSAAYRERQRIALGWQATPMLEQTAGSPLAPREQLTQSSVHRLQFGGPDCTETSFGATRGGIGRSAATAV
jgi:hypothetical protein